MLPATLKDFLNDAATKGKYGIEWACSHKQSNDYFLKKYNPLIEGGREEHEGHRLIGCAFLENLEGKF
jgi:hypothetical protein